MNRQPSSFDTLCSPSTTTTTSYNSEPLSETINSLSDDNNGANRIEAIIGSGSYETGISQDYLLNSSSDERANHTYLNNYNHNHHQQQMQHDDSLNDLSLKFEKLQRQIEILNETQSSQDERYKRTRQENDTLLNRIHNLEDQLRDLEENSESRLREEEKRFKETMAKQLKSQSVECEKHLHSNYLLQEEIYKLKNDLMKSEQLISKLRSEKGKLELELQDKNSELSDLDAEIHRLKLIVSTLRQEENVKSNIISILNEQLEDSQNRSHHSEHQQHHHSPSSNNFNNNNNQDHFQTSSPKQRSTSSRRSSITSGYGDGAFTNGNSSTCHDDELTNSARITLKDFDGLEMSLSKLKDENKRLKEMNEELQAQLLNVQLEEGRSLVDEGNKSYSLADELGDIDVTRLMKALKEQQDDNARLRKYMDSILLKIVENNPEILERSCES